MPTFFFTKKTKEICKRVKNGFTILELMIVISIMAVITSIVLFNNRDLNSSILVSNTAYEINLLIREAQAYGLGVRGIGDTSSSFSYAQGVFFDLVTPDQVILFSDTDGNGTFTQNSNEEIQVYNLDTKRAGTILSLCRPTGVDTCEPLESSSLAILFKRPNPESLFKIGTSDSNGPVVINTGFTGVQGMCRSIIVQKTGAIQVSTEYCF